MIQHISVQDLKSRLTEDEKAVVIDVRTSGETIGNLIKGAHNFDIMNGTFGARISELDKDMHYYLICRSGARSMQAAMLLDSNGFEHIYNVDGGMMAWNHQN